MIYNKITIGGLEVLGNESCPYYSNLYNFLFDVTNTNNDSSLYSDGDYAGTSKRNAKTFTLVTMVKNENNIKAALQLSYILNKKEEIELIADIENLGEVSCKVKTESITTDDFDTITATLKMCDPNIYTKNYKELELKRIVKGGWLYPTSSFTLPSEWTFTETVLGNNGECVNDGFATVYPELTIIGDAKDIKIKNETTNEQLNLNIEITSDKELYVDCRPSSRCVKYNNINMISYKSGEYISLVSGSNVISVEYDGTCSVLLRWKEAWV